MRAEVYDEVINAFDKITSNLADIEEAVVGSHSDKRTYHLTAICHHINAIAEETFKEEFTRDAE